MLGEGGDEFIGDGFGARVSGFVRDADQPFGDRQLQKPERADALLALDDELQLAALGLQLGDQRARQFDHVGVERAAEAAVGSQHDNQRGLGRLVDFEQGMLDVPAAAATLPAISFSIRA